MSRNPNSPELRPTIVCYADILGFRNKTERSFRRGKGEEFLQRVKRSLSKAYDQVRNHSTLGGGLPFLDMKVFTDNIVVGCPLRYPDEDLGEPELGGLLMLFGHVQASLAVDGFFLRGGITVGQHYQDQDIAFGNALLEAVDLNESGEPPRLVIGSSLEPLISTQISWYRDGLWAPHFRRLLEDPNDEKLFIDYLGMAFAYYRDGPVDYRLLAGHGREVREGLREHDAKPYIRSKYEWLAAYHNFVCRNFTEVIPVLSDERDESEEVTIRLEAKRGLEHLVSGRSNSEIKAPIRLDAQRLQDRLSLT